MKKEPSGQKVGVLLMEARKALGLKKSEVARLTGLPYTTYDSYEKGHRTPDIETVQKIAPTLKKEWYELYGWKNLGNGLIGEEASEEENEELLKRLFPNTRAELNKAFDSLNSEGKKIAVERVKELTEISRYTEPDQQEQKQSDT